jgi:hypothetical protein
VVSANNHSHIRPVVLMGVVVEPSSALLRMLQTSAQKPAILMMFSMVFLSPSLKTRMQHLKLGPERFLLFAFEFKLK